ncbi:MAG TPA: flippase [Patescibacteria group bacterium]
MSLTRQIAQNTIIQYGGKVVGTVLALVTIGLMTRYLGQEGFGQYTIIMAFLQMFGILVDLGLTLTTVQMISEPGVDIDKRLSNIFTLRFFSAIIFLGLAPLTVLLFPYPTIVKVGVAITTLSFFFNALNQIMIGVFQKNLKMDRVAIAEIVNRIVLLAGVWLVVYLNYGLLAIMGAIILSNAVQFVLHYIFALKFVKISFRFDWPVWKKIWQTTWPIAISIVFNLIYLKADTIILSVYQSQAVVGLYGASYKVIDVLIVLPIIFTGLVLPFLTKTWAEKNLDNFKSICQKAFDGVSLLAIPLVVGTLLTARPVMTLIAGRDFVLSGLILQILIFAAFIIYIGALFGHGVIAIGRQKTVIPAYALSAGLSLIGYFIFIPKYSYIGAAGVTIFSEAFVTIYIMIVFYQATKFFPSLGIWLKAILASILMGLVLYFLAGLNIILLIALAVIVYFAALYLFRGISKETVMEIIKPGSQ